MDFSVTICNSGSEGHGRRIQQRSICSASQYQRSCLCTAEKRRPRVTMEEIEHASIRSRVIELEKVQDAGGREEILAMLVILTGGSGPVAHRAVSCNGPLFPCRSEPVYILTANHACTSPSFGVEVQHFWGELLPATRVASSTHHGFPEKGSPADVF